MSTAPFWLNRQGKPQLLYHGTAGRFAAFDSALVGTQHNNLEVGTAFYFTDDLANAQWYAKSAARRVCGPSAEGQVLRVHLRMRHPLVVDFEGQGIETLAEDIQRAKAGGHDGLIALDFDDGGLANHYIVFAPEQIFIKG